jgi:hypothetical protein
MVRAGLRVLIFFESVDPDSQSGSGARKAKMIHKNGKIKKFNE